MTGDYSAYDQTLPSILISLSMFMYKHLIGIADSGSPVTEKLYLDLCGYILYAHAYHPKTGTIKRQRGIFSGTVITNLCDGTTNLAILGYSLRNNDDVSNTINTKICGDDNLLITPSKLDSNTLVSEVGRIGMKVNYLTNESFDKGTPVSSFLGSVWTPEGPERNVRRMAISACLMKKAWPDFQGDKKRMIASRIYSIFGYDHRLNDF